MKYLRWIEIILGLLVPIILFGTELDEAKSEQAEFLRQNSRLIGGSVPVLLSSRRVTSLYYIQEDSYVLSTHLTYGSVASPFGILYEDRLSRLSFGDFYGDVLEWPMVNAGLMVGLSSRLIFYGNGKWGQRSDLGSFSYFGGSGGMLYDIVSETPNMVGLKVGAGYSYWQGEFNRSRERVFDGTAYPMTLRWKGILHGPVADIQLEKSFFFINTYLRMQYTYLMGDVTSRMDIAGNSFQEGVGESAVHGLVASGGMEIMIALFKITWEVGRDLLSSGLYVDVGLRIGLD